MLLGLRHPVTVATELASLDVINGGKSFAAFGLGYRDEELNAFDLNKAQRFSRFVEGVEIIKRLWTEDHVTFEGKEFQIRDVTVDPKPLQSREHRSGLPPTPTPPSNVLQESVMVGSSAHILP
jgi:alkanesulfonate monooxygenase SsuD/methylene tetrahydromethanopterin reductase-like flavin-dependent oxidoreductase (luciferase family)